MVWLHEHSTDVGASDAEAYRWSLEPPEGGRLRGYHAGVTIEDVVAGAVANALALKPGERGESGESEVAGALKRLMNRHPELTRQLAAVADVGPPEYTTDPAPANVRPTMPVVPDSAAALVGLPPAPPEIVPGAPGGQPNG